LHPYTKGLLSSVPTLDGDPDAPLFSIPGQPPDLAALGGGCAFEPRCGLRADRCGHEKPVLEGFLPGGARSSACFERSQLTGDGGDA